MITITLPWPDDTSLNARIHWAKRSSAARADRLTKKINVNMLSQLTRDNKPEARRE